MNTTEFAAELLDFLHSFLVSWRGLVARLDGRRALEVAYGDLNDVVRSCNHLVERAELGGVAALPALLDVPLPRVRSRRVARGNLPLVVAAEVMASDLSALSALATEAWRAGRDPRAVLDLFVNGVTRIAWRASDRADAFAALSGVPRAFSFHMTPVAPRPSARA